MVNQAVNTNLYKHFVGKIASSKVILQSQSMCIVPRNDHIEWHGGY